jgi:hypothetical protein
MPFISKFPCQTAADKTSAARDEHFHNLSFPSQKLSDLLSCAMFLIAASVARMPRRILFKNNICMSQKPTPKIL